MSKGKRVKVLVDPGETCWAETLEPPNVLLLNIPFTDGYNAFDVVEATGLDEGGRVKLGRVVKRHYQNKTCVQYGQPHRENFRELCSRLKVLGEPASETDEFIVEGMFDGAMLVAHNGADIAAIVAPIGRLPRSQPKLHGVGRPS